MVDLVCMSWREDTSKWGRIQGRQVDEGRQHKDMLLPDLKTKEAKSS